VRILTEVSPYRYIRLKIQSAQQNIEDQETDIQRVYDFCRYFQLAERIQNNLFVNRFNSPQLSWIFLSDYEKGIKPPHVSFDFLDAIDTRIMDDLHIILFFFGPTGSGKSEMAQTTAKYYQQRFNELKDIRPPIPLVFNDVEFSKYIPKMGIGDIPIRDESSIATGEGSRILQTRVNNLVQVVRAHQNSFIFVNPDIVKAPLVDYFLETAGILRLFTKITKKEYLLKFIKTFLSKKTKSKIDNLTQIEVFYNGLVYINDQNKPIEQLPFEKDKLRQYLYKKAPYLRKENNPYDPYGDLNLNVLEGKRTRLILYTKAVDEKTNNMVLQPIGRMYLPLHNDKEFRERYQVAKDKNIWQIKRDSGLVQVEADEDVFTKDVFNLYEFLEKYDVYHKTDIKAMLIEYNKQQQDEEKKIRGPHVDEVITRVSLALSGKVPLDYEQESEEASEEMIEEIIKEEEKDAALPIEEKVRAINFEGFEWKNEIYDVIRKNDSSSRKLERDILVHQLSSKRSQDDLAHAFETTQPNISTIIRRMDGKVSYYRGHLFEKFVKKKLEKSNLFSKVVLDAGSGESDILGYTKDHQHLFVYSVKNISIDPDHPYVQKEEFAPEIELCQEFEHDYHTTLIPLIRDDTTSKIIQPLYDYKRPRNITFFT